MKMSKLYASIAFALIGMMVFAAGSVLAQENTSVSNTTTTSSENLSASPAIIAELNDSLEGSVSGTQIGFEHFKLWFTFNNEKKAEQELKIARLRLIQAKVAAQSGDTDAMQRALDSHDDLINRVKDRVDSIDGESSGNGIRSATEKLVGLARAIEVHEAKISKLNEILADANLTDEQRVKVEERISKVEENTDKLREVQMEKRDKLRERLSKVTNLTDDEAESEIEDIEDSHNLSIIRQKVAEKRAEDVAKIREKLEERIAKARENLQESQERTEERIQEAREKAQERITKELNDDSKDKSGSDSGSDDSKDESSDDSEDDSSSDSKDDSSSDSEDKSGSDSGSDSN